MVKKSVTVPGIPGILEAAAKDWALKQKNLWACYFGNCRDFGEDVIHAAGLEYGKDTGPTTGKSQKSGKKCGDDKKSGDDKNDGKDNKK